MIKVVLYAPSQKISELMVDTHKNYELLYLPEATNPPYKLEELVTTFITSTVEQGGTTAFIVSRDNLVFDLVRLAVYKGLILPEELVIFYDLDDGKGVQQGAQLTKYGRFSDGKMSDYYAATTDVLEKLLGG